MVKHASPYAGVKIGTGFQARGARGGCRLRRMDFLMIVSAVLTANLLTAWFLWGMTKAFKIGGEEAAPFTVIGALLIPLFFAGVGAFLFAAS